MEINGRKVNEIGMKFSFSQAALLAEVAHLLDGRDPETPKQRTDRKSQSKGLNLTWREEFVSAADLLSDLGVGQFIVVSGKYAQTNEDRTGFSVWFTFVPKENNSARESADAKEALIVLLRDYWTAQVFQNPWFSNHIEVPGESAISIKFVGRKPISQKPSIKFRLRLIESRFGYQTP